MKGIGVAIIVAGIVGLAYGGFTYTRNTHTAQIGSVALTVKDQQTVRVPIWGGVAAIVCGVLLLAMPTRKA